MPVVGAGLDVTAHDSGTAMFDRRHYLELVEAQMPGMVGPVGGAGSAEDVGNLKGGAHRPQPPGVLPSIAVASLSSGLVTARIVRVATLV